MKKYTLTEEHKAQLKPWADQWISNAMSTKPMDNEERALCREAVKGLYRAANLDPPPDHRIVFVPSPFVARFAGGFAAAIWYLRKNKKPTYAATIAATSDATDDATYASISAATRASISAATDAATRAAISDATDDATYASISAATRASISAATDAATRDATSDATDAATSDAKNLKSNNWYKLDVDGLVKLSNVLGIGKFGLICAQNAWNMWNGGNQWSGWPAFITFFRYVVKLKIDYSKWHHYEVLAKHSSYRIMHEKFCIISDRPEILTVNAQNRPHNETGPFCKWRDGSSLYSLNGIRVPAWVVEKKVEDFTREDISKTDNADVRREIIRKIGSDAAVKLLGGKVIHEKDYSGAKYFQTHEGRKYQLLECDFGTGVKRKYLKMTNGSVGVEHIEAIHPDCKTVDQALGFREQELIGESWKKKGYKYEPPAVLF